MPILPYLTGIQSKAQLQDKFLGLCMRETANESQFVRMADMSSDQYPYLAPRKERHWVRGLTDARALLGGEALSWVSDGKLYFDGEEICAVTSEQPQLVRMGAYLIVWPDRIIYNTHTGELTQMDASYTNVKTDGVETLIVRPCMISGQEYNYTASDAAPANPAQYDYWYDTLNEAFYQYLDGWQGIDTVYSRIEGAGLGQNIKEYDVVSLTGFSYDEYNMEAATVYARGEDYIVIATGTVRSFDEGAEITIRRTAPDMDYICENGNRLWGCCSEKHEIYGSKLGDPTNWHSFLGISTDSYAATVGSEGNFTGLINYMGYVHFFKEDRCHRLYGTRPENFQLVELPIRGVKTGCHKSLCVVNGILYYVHRTGVMAFDGSSPVDVGDVLGNLVLDDVVCGAHGHKLYLSAQCEIQPDYAMHYVDVLDDEPDYREAADGQATFVMDTHRGMWHRESGLDAIGYASTSEGDFALTRDGDLMLIDGGISTYDDDEQVDDHFWWFAETGDYGQDSPNKKWVKRLTYRIKAEKGSRMIIDIQYDGDRRWHRALTYEGTGKRTETLNVRTRRCDHFRLRYFGIGRVLVLSMAKTYDEGSER